MTIADKLYFDIQTMDKPAYVQFHISDDPFITRFILPHIKNWVGDYELLRIFLEQTGKYQKTVYIVGPESDLVAFLRRHKTFTDDTYKLRDLKIYHIPKEEQCDARYSKRILKLNT